MKGFRDVQLDPRSLALGGLLGLGAGVLGGYLVARRVLGASFNERLDSEVSSVKAHYNGQLKSLLLSGTGSGPVPEPVGDDGLERGGELEGYELPEPGDEDEVVQPGDDDDESGLGEENPGIGYEVPVSPRGKLDRPSIISAAELADADPGWQQLTITWYSGDGVLTDDKDQPVRDIPGLLGVIPQKRMFGGVSGDPSIMYVRNPRLEIDFEVIWDDRSYVDVVLNYGSPK